MTGRPEVFGPIDFDRDGAAAEYVTLPASELAARPRSVSQAQTATLPLAALAAWQALTDYTAVEPGERVLVHGGSGGVGVFAVQLAAYLGGHVTATGRGADDGFACRLGAETFVSTADGGLEGGDLRRRRRRRHRRRRGSFSQIFSLRDGRRAFESGACSRPPGKTVLAVR